MSEIIKGSKVKFVERLVAGSMYFNAKVITSDKYGNLVDGEVYIVSEPDAGYSAYSNILGRDYNKFLRLSKDTPGSQWAYPTDVFELVEEEENFYGYVSDEDYKNLSTIFDRDYEFYDQLSGLIKYLASTYNDKYEGNEPNAFHPRELLTSDVCMFNVSKYLKRYTTKGYDKSNNSKDVLKSIHYLLISLQNDK